MKIKKIKNIVAIVFFLFIALVTNKGFGQECFIYGSTAKHLTYKYAYLYDSDTKLFVTAPVVDNQFSFRLDKPQKLKILILSFNTDLIKNYKEVLESPDYKYPNGTRMIALEDTVKVTLKDYPKDAIVQGKILNKDIDDMYLSMRSKEFELFFEKHPDSPIAIVFLKALSKFSFNGSPIYTIQQRKQSYDKLSNTLKNSEEGKELFLLLNKESF